MYRNRIKIINWIFALLMIATIILGGIWCRIFVLQDQNSDLPIGLVVGPVVLCYFGFFILVAEGVLWRIAIHFAFSTSCVIIIKIGRIVLCFLSLAELIGAVFALYLAITNTDYKLFELLASVMLGISAVQILCQFVIWIVQWGVSHKQTTSS